MLVPDDGLPPSAPPTEVEPDGFCEDWKRVQDTIATYRRLEERLQEALADLVAAKTDRERAQLQDVVQRYKDGLAQWRPDFERALKCTTSV